MFVETKFFHKAGEGSGGGDQHNLGYYADLTALQTAYPTGTDGDFAILGSTDTVWVWDSGTSAWKDTDTKGQVTSVNNQTGDVTIGANDVLPSQAGNSGKFLTTDGTDASWSDKPLVNQSTASINNNLFIGLTGGHIPTGTNEIAIKSHFLIDTAVESFVSIGSNHDDNGRKLGAYSIQILGNATGLRSLALGPVTKATGKDGIAINTLETTQGDYSIAIGPHCATNADRAIQIGSSSTTVTNSDANTFKVANANGNFEIMSADGTIPKERLTKVVTTPSTAPVLAVADWSSNTQTITVTGVTATNTVFVAPAPASAADYAAAGILCTAQAADSLTFTCTTVPTNAITLSVVILG